MSVYTFYNAARRCKIGVNLDDAHNQCNCDLKPITDAVVTFEWTFRQHL